MHFGAQLLQALLMLDAEMLLLVNDDKTEIFKTRAFAKHRMRADNNIDLAGCGPELGDLEIGGSHHP